MTRIAIVGAGANGSSIGADLIGAGEDVTLIEQWPAHVEKMRADGLRIISPEGEVHVQPDVRHFCQVAELRGRFDVVLMLVKAYDTPWASRLIEPYLAEDGILVGVQNGMTAGVIAEAVGPRRTLGCVIECSATMTDPGLVHRHTPASRSWFAIGEIAQDGPGHHIPELSRILRLAGTVEVVDDILAAKWMKLVSNSTLLVTSAILGVPMLDALHMTGFRDVMIAAGNEALTVGAAEPHPVLPIFGLNADEIRDPDRVVDIMTDKLFASFVVPGATTTVLQDWRKGRRSEADDLNGHIVTRAAVHGIPAPVNARVVALARRIEAGEISPDVSHLALLREPLEH